MQRPGGTNGLGPLKKLAGGCDWRGEEQGSGGTDPRWGPEDFKRGGGEVTGSGLHSFYSHKIKFTILK